MLAMVGFFGPATLLSIMRACVASGDDFNLFQSPQLVFLDSSENPWLQILPILELSVNLVAIATKKLSPISIKLTYSNRWALQSFGGVRPPQIAGTQTTSFSDVYTRLNFFVL